MDKVIRLLVIISLVSSCGEIRKPKQGSKQKTFESTALVVKRPRFKTIDEVIEPNDGVRYWASKESYYPTLGFYAKDTIWVLFDGQCEYGFPYKKHGGNLFVYWDNVVDCNHDLGLKQTFGLKSRPSKGKPFITLELRDDTTLHATYMFPEWTDSLNSRYKGYQYFPEVFLSCGD